MARVEAIAGGIAPSPYADVGRNVIRAIASYAGKPVRCCATAARRQRYALIDSRRFTIAPPGRLPLDSRRFSLVEVPRPARCARALARPALGLDGRGDGAGILASRAQRAGLAGAAAAAAVAPCRSRADAPHHTRLGWGEHRGGMFVTVEGGRDGERLERSWHMIAEGDDGPFIPSMAAEAIIRHCVAGRPPAPGARTGAPTSSSPTTSRCSRGGGSRPGPQTPPAGEPLYRRMLRRGLCDRCPPAAGHARSQARAHARQASPGRARHRCRFARLVASIVGFPPAGEDVPVKVTFRLAAAASTGCATLRAARSASIQEEGRGRFERLLCETLRPAQLAMALVVEDGRLRLMRPALERVRHSLLPLWLADRAVIAYEFADGRPLPLPRRDRPSADRTDRALSRLAGHHGREPVELWRDVPWPQVPSL